MTIARLATVKANWNAASQIALTSKTRDLTRLTRRYRGRSPPDPATRIGVVTPPPTVCRMELRA